VQVGFLVRLRLAVHQVVSTVSCMRFVSLPIAAPPVALLLAGRMRPNSPVGAFGNEYALMNCSWLARLSVIADVLVHVPSSCCRAWV